MKDIPGFEGRYAVTAEGMVWSYPKIGSSREGKYLAPVRFSTGYEVVSLCILGGKTRQYSIHRLVADAFIPKSHGKNVVNHKNFIKHDNRAENLEWATQEENVTYSRKSGHYPSGTHNKSAKLTEEQVKSIRREHSPKNRNQSSLGRKYGVSQSVIWNIINKRTWKHVT